MAARYGHFGIEECVGQWKPSAGTGQKRAFFGQSPYNFHYTRKPIPAANALTERKVWSGREDLNLRPPAPKAGQNLPFNNRNLLKT